MKNSGNKEIIEKADMVIVVKDNEYNIIKNRYGKRRSGNIKEE